jgi:phosphoglycerate-specific signal transduction histidine kinase
MWILICERTRQLTTINEELRQEIADRQRVEEATPESQAGLAHATRVLWLEELVTSIATESTTADRIRANLVVAREEDAQLGVKLLHKTKALCLVARALAIQQAFDPAVTVAPSLVGAPGNGTIAGDCDRAAASE